MIKTKQLAPAGSSSLPMKTGQNPSQFIAESTKTRFSRLAGRKPNREPTTSGVRSVTPHRELLTPGQENEAPARKRMAADRKRVSVSREFPAPG